MMIFYTFGVLGIRINPEVCGLVRWGWFVTSQILSLVCKQGCVISVVTLCCLKNSGKYIRMAENKGHRPVSGGEIGTLGKYVILI
jgi:hypothetical protein